MDLTPKYKRKAAVKLEKFPHYRSMHPSPTLSLCNRFKSIVEKYLTLLITGYLEEIYYAGQKAWHLARRQLVVTLFGRLCMSLLFHFYVEMFYLNTIEQLFLFVEQLDQLKVCLPYSRLLAGIQILAVFQNLRWNSNKTSLVHV